MNVEIEFLEWVHPKAGITKVQMEGGKPLVLKAKIKHEWVGLTDEEIDQGLLRSFYALQSAGAWREGVAWAMQQLKDKNNV